MKWLNVAVAVQTAGVLGLALRAWPFTKTLQNSEQLKGPTLPAGPTPPVTIIVPARNEELNIERCLHSLLAQDYPRFEVVVVDDGSQDATPQINKEIRKICD